VSILNLEVSKEFIQELKEDDIAYYWKDLEHFRSETKRLKKHKIRMSWIFAALLPALGKGLQEGIYFIVTILQKISESKVAIDSSIDIHFTVLTQPFQEKSSF
jgi:hypothetical protein